MKFFSRKKNIVSKVDFILSSLKEYVLKRGREKSFAYVCDLAGKEEKIDKPSRIITKFPPATTVALINFVYQ